MFILHALTSAFVAFLLLFPASHRLEVSPFSVMFILHASRCIFLARCDFWGVYDKLTIIDLSYTTSRGF